MLRLKKGQKYSDLTIEQIIESLSPEYDMNQAYNSIKKQSLDPKEHNQIIQKLEYAKKRITEPLEVSLKIMYFIMPFGITSSFTPNETDDITKFKKLGNIKKIKDYYKCSILGMLFYIIGGIILGLFF